MTKRMHFYLNYYKELLEKDLSPEKAQQERARSRGQAENQPELPTQANRQTKG